MADLAKMRAEYLKTFPNTPETNMEARGLGLSQVGQTATLPENAPQTPPATPIPPVAAPPSAANGFGTGIPPSTAAPSETDLLRKSLYETSQITQNPEQVRQEKLKQFQLEIDAINNVYAGILSTAQQQGVGRLGQERAMEARGGRIGSPMGAAQKSAVEAQNLDIERSVQAEQAAKVAEVLSEASSKADEEIARQREAKQQGAETYLKYLEGADTKKQSNASAVLQSLLGQGVKLEDLSQDEYNSLTSSLGLSPKDFNTIYTGELKKADATAAATAKDFAIQNNITKQFYTLDGKTIYDTATGKVVDPQQYIAAGGDPNIEIQPVQKPITKNDLLGGDATGYYQILPDGSAKLVIPPANKLKYQKIGGTSKAPVYGFVDDQGNIYDANKNPLTGNKIPTYSGGDGNSTPTSGISEKAMATLNKNIDLDIKLLNERGNNREQVFNEILSKYQRDLMEAFPDMTGPGAIGQMIHNKIYSEEGGLLGTVKPQ